MKSSIINIPIYECTLELILDVDLKHIEKEYGTDSLDGFGAITMQHPVIKKNYIVAFTDKEHLSNIVHESVHVKNYLFLDCAMENDRVNDEPEAYLMGWLFNVMHNFLKDE